uniref:Uncharacterized protein n=1 Tax=Panagrolaimus davidi TaxID=227884 RepID=A0A914PI90_9BILA
MENDDVEDASDGDEDDSDDDEEEVAGNESDLDDVDERGESGEDDTFCYGDMLNSVRRRKKKRVGVSKGGNDVENVDANAASLGESSVHLSGQAGEIVVGQGGGDAAPREEMVVTKRKPGRPKKNAENDQTKSRPGRPKRVADHLDENEVAHLTNLIQNTEEDYIYDMVLLHFNYPLDWCKNNQGPQKAKARRCIIAALHGKYGNHIKENSFKNKFNSAIQKARDKKELALRNGINNIEYTRAEYLILERTGPVLSEQIDVDDLGFGGVRRSNRRRKLTKIHTPATTSDDSVYVEPASKQRRDLHQAVEIHNDDLRADVSEEIISGSHQNDDFDIDAFDAFVVGENSRSTPPPGNYPSSTPLPLNTDPDSSLLMPPSPMAQRRLHFSDLFSPVSSDSFSITTEEERSFLSPTPLPVITPQAETPISGYNENSQTSPFLQYSNLSYNLTPMQPRSSSSSLQQQNQPILSPQQQPRSTPTFQQQQHQPILSPQQQPRSTPSFQQQQHQPILSPQQQPRSTPSFQQQQQRPVLTPQQQQQQQQPILSPQQQQQQQQPILSPQQQQQRPVLTPQQRRLLPSFSLARTAPPRTAYGKNDVYNAAFRAQTSNEKSNADFQNLLQLHQRNASSNQELREQILRNLAIESENRAKISQIQLQNEQRSLIASNFFHPSMPRNLRPHNPSNLPSRSSSTPLQNPRNPNFLNSSYPNRRLED